MGDRARTLYLVCYDIADPARLNRVRKYLTGYKVGGQKSFFECWLTASELVEVCRTLGEMIDLEDDRAHVFQLDPRMACDFLGQARKPVIDVFMIV